MIKSELSNALIAVVFVVVGTTGIGNHSIWSKPNPDRISYSIDLPERITQKQKPIYNREEVIKSFSKRLQRGYSISEVKADRFSQWILNAEDLFRIHRDVMAALIMTESSFRTNVVSVTGAVGPAQVQPFFWKQNCEGDITNDPEANILCGAQVLSRYKRECGGDIRCAFERYNVGPNNYKRKTYNGAKERYIGKMKSNHELIAQTVW